MLYLNSLFNRLSSMRTRFPFLILCFCLCFTFKAFAQEVKATIGVIDWRAAVFSSEKAREENDKIRKAYEKDAERLKALESRIRTNQQKLDKNSAIMSTQDKEKLLGELQKDILDYQQLGQGLQQSIQQKEQEFLASQRVNLREAIEAISKEKGLEVVLNKESVVYGKAVVDITPDVINFLNKRK